MRRISTNYRELKLDYLDPEDLNVIEIRAKALSLDECYDYLCIDKEDLPEDEARYAKKAWRRGRMSALSTAADKLFSSMEGRNGGQIAFDYLRSLSSTFSLEPTSPGAGSTSGGGFSFNVVLPEDSVSKTKNTKPADIKSIK